MAQIIWTEPALDDLNGIAEYIALNKPSTAAKLVKKVLSSTEPLEQFPKSGREPPELEGFRYREIIVPPCRFFYRNETDIIYILYVMRSERELRKYIFSDRNETRKM